MKALRALIEERDQKTSELDGLTRLVETEERDLTSEEETRSATLISEIDTLDGRITEEKRAAEKQNTLTEARKLVAGTEPAGTTEINEPMVYGPGSPYSHGLDLARRTMALFGQTTDGGASERLAKWEHQVEREYAHDSKAGRAAEKQLRELSRELGENPAKEAMREFRERGTVALEQKAELRVSGITSGGGATASSSGGGGAAFVSPIIMLGDYAPYREFGRAFVDQCNRQPLPDWGMNVYIPQVTSGAEVAEQTEGEPIAEKDPAAGFLTGALGWEAGEVIVTQQLLDRAGPNFSYDKMLFDQLQRNYAPKVDAYGLSKVIAVAHEQTWTGETGKFVLTAAGGAGGFYGQVSKAKAFTRKAEGTVLNPTHAFYDPARWEYIAAWSDTQGRPVVVPDYAGPFNAVAAGSATGDVGIEGWTGYKFNGLRAFTDANIPTQGTTGRDQVIIGDLAEVYWFEGDPVMRVIPQTLAKNLQVLLQLYAYRTIIVRYPNGIVIITGTGLSTISYTN